MKTTDSKDPQIHELVDDEQQEQGIKDKESKIECSGKWNTKY